MNNSSTSAVPSAEALLLAIHEHLDRFDGLLTFQDVAIWDETATKHVHNLASLCRWLQRQIEALEIERANAETAYRNRSFLTRAFSASPALQIQPNIDRMKAMADKCSGLLDLLYANIDFSPNDPTSKKAVIAELKHKKKELQLEKREIGMAAQLIRTEARQRSAGVPYSAGAFFAGRKWTALERQSIRHAKERALAPHEEAKAFIDRQIHQIDRLVLWAERLS